MQRFHMKHKALFSSKDKSKQRKKEVSSAAILLGSLLSGQTIIKQLPSMQHTISDQTVGVQGLGYFMHGKFLILGCNFP